MLKSCRQFVQDGVQSNMKGSVMPKFTVIVLHSNGEVVQNVTEAKDDFTAMGIVAREMEGVDAEIIGAIAGDVILQPPCDCSGHAAHVTDMANLYEDTSSNEVWESDAQGDVNDFEDVS